MKIFLICQHLISVSEFLIQTHHERWYLQILVWDQYHHYNIIIITNLKGTSDSVAHRSREKFLRRRQAPSYLQGVASSPVLSSSLLLSPSVPSGYPNPTRLILPPEVPFFVVRKQSLLPKVPIIETQKMALLVAKSKFRFRIQFPIKIQVRKS